MVRRSKLCGILTVVALLGARSAGADAISFTGNVANDFPISNTSSNVDVLASDWQVAIPDHIAEQPWQVAEGLNSGWNLQDLRMSYDAKTDTMYVGVSTYGHYAGDIVGNGGQPDPNLNGASVDPPNFGLDKSITVGFAPNSPSINPANPPSPVIVAGVPGPKSGPDSQAGPGLDGFNVASYVGSSVNGSQNILNLPGGYGQTLTQGLGALAFNPDPSHPGFEFTITNFSKISGLDPSKGVWVEVYAGSEQTQIAGKDFQQGLFLPPLPQTISTPEPATWLAWTLVAGGAAVSLRRRARR